MSWERVCPSHAASRSPAGPCPDSTPNSVSKDCLFPVLMLIEMGRFSADNYAFYLLKSGGHQVRALAPNLLRLCLHHPRWRGVLLYFNVSGTFTPTLLTSRLREFLSLFFASHSARISDSGEPFRSQTTNRYLSKFPLLLVVTIDIYIFTLESPPVLMIPFFWVL